MSEVAVPAFLLETRGTARDLGAFVVAAAFDRAGRQAAFALGDGTLRFVDLPNRFGEWTIVEAHDGAVLCLMADLREGFVSGGDDGRLARVSAAGEVTQMAAFGGKWVDQAASFSDGKSGVIACAAGKFVHLFSAAGEKLRSLEHPSTVTGISFDGKGKRVAVSHYNGASLWFVGSSAGTPRRLEWKGSHTGVALHPAAEAVVTCMQENALHGWRLPDEHDMRMSGYPVKPESLSFTRSGKYLASSGADAIVLWPFFGGGPMGKPPVELAQQDVLCTRVACHPRDDIVAAGYADGSVVLVEIASQRVLPVKPASDGPVSALAWGGNGGWLAIGTEKGFGAIVDLSSRAA